MSMKRVRLMLRALGNQGNHAGGSVLPYSIYPPFRTLVCLDEAQCRRDQVSFALGRGLVCPLTFQYRLADIFSRARTTVTQHPVHETSSKPCLKFVHETS